MTKRRFALKTALLAGALAFSAVWGLGASPAAARVVVGVGIGVPLVVGPAPWYYYPPPPVVYAPPPVVYAPAPQPTYLSQSPQAWYYCDNPAGYYPYVTTCSSAWRQVPARP